MFNDTVTWIGIALCISQSAMFSGLNLAMLGVSRLQLEVQADIRNPAAMKLLALRKDSNFLLTTVLWGNVGANVFLTLLSDSILTGAWAFVLSTFLITFGGEIVPQAYFSRNALRMASLLSPVLRFYQVLLYPVAKPSAKLLDLWLGKEGIDFFREQDLRKVIMRHVASPETDLGHVEGVGALNFLTFDDLPVALEGETVDPASVIRLPVENHLPVFPAFDRTADDPFLRAVQASGKKWTIVVSPDKQPVVALDADGFLRAALFGAKPVKPRTFCHRPIVVRDGSVRLGEILPQLKVHSEHAEDDVIDQDLILFWADEKRVITGSDVLGRLLRGIAKRIPQ